MSDDFEIELIAENIAENEVVQLPLNFLRIGEIEHDDVRVYIKQSVYSELQKFSSSNTKQELGSILIGDYSENNGKYDVIISDFIEAKYTDASASTLTFTHKTWDYIHKEKEKHFKEKTILGWQHTHPGYGIFLSNYDLFIHENFFNMDFQIAYVIDPVQNLRGFFQWKNDKVQKINGFYIYDDVGKKIKIEGDIPKSESTDFLIKKKPSNTKATSVVLSLLLLVIAILGANLFIQNKKLVQSELIRESYKNELEAQSEVVQDLQLQLETKENFPSSNNQIDGTPDITSSLFFRTYEVKDGDTLFEICRNNNISYSDNIKIILAVNNIDDADSIDVGQKILLPVEEN